MLRIMLGTWALAGVLTGGLLTAVAQNPPAAPESVNDDQQQGEQSSPATSEQVGQAQDSATATPSETGSAEQPSPQPPSADQPPRHRQESAGQDTNQNQPSRRESQDTSRNLQDERPPESAALERGGVTEDPNDLGIQFRTSNTGGLMISSLDRGGAAFQSGLREGDQIVSVGGRTFAFEPALREFLLRQSDRQQIPVVVMRDGRRETVTWSLQPQIADRQPAFEETVPRTVRRPEIDAAIPQPGIAPPPDAQPGLHSRVSIGVRVVDSQRGPHVADVIPGSPAAEAGLREGDFIIRLDGQQYWDSRRFASDISRAAAGRPLNLDVYRNGQTFSMQVRPESYAAVYGRSPDGSGQAGTLRPHEVARPNFELMERIEQLESEVNALRSQMQALQRMRPVHGDPAGQRDARERGESHGRTSPPPAGSEDRQDAAIPEAPNPPVE